MLSTLTPLRLVSEYSSKTECQRPLTGSSGWSSSASAFEAAELTAAIGADVLIPMHNDLFAANHVAPAVLADCLDRIYPRQKYHWLQPDELYFCIRG